MYELARTYIVIERGEVPPFVLAEVVGCAVEPEAGSIRAGCGRASRPTPRR